MKPYWNGPPPDVSIGEHLKNQMNYIGYHIPIELIDKTNNELKKDEKTCYINLYLIASWMNRLMEFKIWNKNIFGMSFYDLFSLKTEYRKDKWYPRGARIFTIKIKTGAVRYGINNLEYTGKVKSVQVECDEYIIGKYSGNGKIPCPILISGITVWKLVFETEESIEIKFKATGFKFDLFVTFNLAYFDGESKLNICQARERALKYIGFNGNNVLQYKNGKVNRLF